MQQENKEETPLENEQIVASKNNRLRSVVLDNKLLVLSLSIAILFILGLAGYAAYKGIKLSQADTSSNELTLATWNVHEARTDKNIGDDVSNILKHADVVGIQEVHHPYLKKSLTSSVTCSKCPYAGYVTKTDYDGSSYASLPIIWNKSKYKLVKQDKNPYYAKVSDKVNVLDGTVKASVSSKWITWALLETIATGKRFYVVNTHTVASVERVGQPNPDNSDRVALYKKHMEKLKSTVKSLKSVAKYPVFITGDFNVSYRTNNRTMPSTLFPYTSVTDQNFASNWEIASLADIKGSYVDSGRLIDYIFARSGTASKVSPVVTGIDTSLYGSDHYPVYYTVQLLTSTP